MGESVQMKNAAKPICGFYTGEFLTLYETISYMPLKRIQDSGPKRVKHN